jgi:hypothetical protein
MGAKKNHERGEPSMPRRQAANGGNGVPEAE